MLDIYNPLQTIYAHPVVVVNNMQPHGVYFAFQDHANPNNTIIAMRMDQECAKALAQEILREVNK